MSAKFPRGGGGAGPFLARSLEAYSNQTACPKCPKCLSVHIISGVYLLYYFRYECQNSCLNAFRVMESHASLPLPPDLEKSCQ